MPHFSPLALRDVIEVVPDRFGDARGYFSEVYNKALWSGNGVDVDFVQDNHSLSGKVGTLRGLHYQLAPFAQAKLVRVVRGAVFDVAVDIRKGSPTFAQWVGLELTASKGNQLFVPAGFAHGFLTLEPDTEVLYKVSDYYSREHERSIRFDDPDIAIDWPGSADQPVLSEKDREAPRLSEIDASTDL
ncbi:dTDP-4-dehydrorhamnose 3,5-epimerase [Cucumibacter marinus]|uniref:dTDP-4-dehydrorhamnose 3,5-epimerase n=1 Tax=Cucumibacter marinus TaxID=1121252 RepID=UPI0003FE514A|nr:dTDP-4-dehydrorhamnose 3,5-epimerase [Cucumibacter marinus]